MSGDTHDIIFDLPTKLDPTIASTHKDYGQLDTKFEIDIGTLANFKVYFKTVHHTLAAASTSAVTDFFPAGALILGLSSRVTTAITGATNWDLGYVGDDDAFGSALALAAGTTSSYGDWVVTFPTSMAAEVDLLFTANVSAFTAGVVRVFCIYATLTAPTA